MLVFVLLPLFAAPTGTTSLRNTQITAEHFTIDNKVHTGHYTGNVKVLRDTLTLTCDSLEALSNEAGKVTQIIATGHVVAIDSDREAHSEAATYDNVTGVLVATGHPWARQGTREVEGTEITFTTGADRLMVKKARTRAPDEKSKTGSPIVIDADQLVLENAKSTAVWRGNVRAVRGPTTLTAPELEATWNGGGDITHLSGRGGIVATEPTRWAKGQRAEFDVTKGVLVVTGKPEAHQGNNHLRGTKVTLYPGTEFLEVDHATAIFDVDPKKGASK